MKKWFALLALTLAVCLMLTACGCEHDWENATCEDPETCEKCGETQGAPLGHSWLAATCSAPKTCEDCGETKGDALEHSWVDATCTEAKTCSACGETDGEPLGHLFAESEPDCENPVACGTCGELSAQPTEHQWIDATTEAPKTCAVCGKTEGDPLPSVTVNPTVEDGLGVNAADFGELLEYGVDTLGMELSYWGYDYDEDGYIYDIYELYNGGEYTTVDIYLITDPTDTEICYIYIYSPNGADETCSNQAGQLFGLAASLLDSTFGADDLTAMMANYELDGTEGICYYYEKNGLYYEMDLYYADGSTTEIEIEIFIMAA